MKLLSSLKASVKVRLVYPSVFVSNAQKQSGTAKIAFLALNTPISTKTYNAP